MYFRGRDISTLKLGVSQFNAWGTRSNSAPILPATSIPESNNLLESLTSIFVSLLLSRYQRKHIIMRRAEMFVELVSILALLGFAIGVHTDQDGGDLEARSAQPQPSWVDLGPLPFGEVPHEEDVVVEKFPLDTLITRASNTADSTEQSEFTPLVP